MSEAVDFEVVDRVVAFWEKIYLVVGAKRKATEVVVKGATQTTTTEACTNVTR
jgi:hypothetical protein